MTEHDFKEKAIKIITEFGLPNPPEIDADFKDILTRVESECSQAEDLHKSLDRLLSEWEVA